MTVTATMPFSYGPGASLTVSIAGSPGVSLDTFVTWAAGLDLSTGFSSLFDPSNYLTLDSVTFNFLPNTGQMLSFGVTVSTTQEWVVIPQLITVGEMTFTLSSTMLGSSPLVTGTLGGSIILGANPPVTIDVAAAYPSYLFSGSLPEGSTVDLSSLIAYLIPTAVDIPEIDLTEFGFTCMPSGTAPLYAIQAMLTSDWELVVGPFGLSVTEAWMNLSYSAGTTTGSIGGTIVFNDDVTFTVTYAIPGVFSVTGVIPEINLSGLIAELVNIAMALPSGFDLSFSNCYISVCYNGSTGQLCFQTSADVSGLGTVSFEALEVGGQWGYSVGLSMGNVSVADVPGLSALAPFVSFFQFQELVLIVSTSNLGSFTFPNVPPPSGSSTTTSYPTVTLPSGQSIIAGMNAYAQVDLNSQPDLQLLMQILNMTAMLAVTLQIGMNDVADYSSVSASIVGQMTSNLQVTGSLIGSMVGDVVSVSVKGSLATVIQDQPVTFSLLISLEPNGLLLSGSYEGTIDFCIFTLSNLILEIGVDFEEIPTVGFGAQIDTAVYGSSVMILFDSVIPTQSMFMGTVTEMSLGTFVDNLCGILQAQPPTWLMDTLNVVSLGGTNPFSIADSSNSVADSLNDLDVAAVSAAFATVGITLPSSQSQVIITVATESELWFVTDLVNLYYYTLKKSGSGEPVKGSLDPQLYIVPQTTQLGTTIVQQGFRANGALNVFGFTASLTVEIVSQQGFTIDAAFTPIVIAVSGYPVFSLTGQANDLNSGPELSVCTFTNSAQNLTPHFYATGYVNVLGVISGGVTVNITSTGASFSCDAKVEDVATFNMSGSYSSPTNFSLSGSAAVGVDQTFNFGALGNIPFDATVDYSYSVAVTSSTSGSASASGGFTFAGESLSIPSFTLALNTTSLLDIVNEAAGQVEAALQLFIDESENWLTWLGEGIVQGITGGAEQVGAILGSSFELAYDDIATQTTDILSYTTDQVTQALQGAGATADETYDVLVNTLDVSADEATSAVDSFFTGASHLDIPHADSTGAHVDDGHTDTTTDHVDDGHDDMNTDHVDSKLSHDDAHWDAWGSPQSHTDNSPHDDTSLHTDIGHDDTALHTDLPHDDTAAHYDTPHSDGPA